MTTAAERFAEWFRQRQFDSIPCEAGKEDERFARKPQQLQATIGHLEAFFLTVGIAQVIGIDLPSPFVSLTIALLLEGMRRLLDQKRTTKNVKKGM